MEASTATSFILWPCPARSLSERAHSSNACLLHSSDEQCQLQVAPIEYSEKPRLYNKAVFLTRIMEQFKKHIERWISSLNKNSFSCVPITAHLKVCHGDAAMMQVICDFLVVPKKLFCCLMESPSKLQHSVQVYSAFPEFPDPRVLDQAYAAHANYLPKQTSVYPIMPRVVQVPSAYFSELIRRRTEVVKMIRQRAAGYPVAYAIDNETAYRTWQHAFSILRKFIKRPPGSCRNRLMFMHETRQLEVIDPEHRSGTELYDAWKVWKVSPMEQNFTRTGIFGVNFFDWLNQSTGSTYEGMPVVTYLTDRARHSYELHGAGVRLQVGPNKFVTLERGKFGSNNLPCPHTHNLKTEPQIYVISASFKPYIITYKKGEIQHSTMLHGEPVMTAGEVPSAQGEPLAGTQKSGHYRSDSGGDDICVTVNHMHHILKTPMSHVHIATGSVEESFSGMERDTRGQMLLVPKACYEKYLKMSKAGVYWGNFHEWLKNYWIPRELREKLQKNPNFRVPNSVMEFLSAEEAPVPASVFEFFAKHPVKELHETYFRMQQDGMCSGTFYEWFKNYWIPEKSRTNPNFYAPPSVIEFLVPEAAPIPAPVAEFLATFIPISVMEFLAAEQAHNQRARALRLTEIKAECTAWERSRQLAAPSEALAENEKPVEKVEKALKEHYESRPIGYMTFGSPRAQAVSA